MRIMKLIAVSIVILSGAPAFSQQFAQAITELQKIQNAYSDSGYNSFTIKYQYSKESAPAKILDTLSFQYKMKGKNYYCSVEKIEFVQNDSINVAVYHNEKTIILSNPAINTSKGRIAIDNWDSAFVAANIDSVNVSENKNARTIKFHFTASSKFSSCSITYSNTTFQPQKISYTERSSQYYEEGQTKQDGIVITMLFSAINKSAFNDAVFSEKKFITTQNSKKGLSSSFQGYNMVNNTYKTE